MRLRVFLKQYLRKRLLKVKMSGHVKKRAEDVTFVLNRIRWGYDVKFKAMVLNDAEKTSNYNAARKFILAGKRT